MSLRLASIAAVAAAALLALADGPSAAPEAPRVVPVQLSPDAQVVFWVGTYGYASNAMPAVRFSAILVERNGRLTGQIIEPNTFGAHGAATLSASVEGRLNGDVVEFTKTYDGRGGVSHRVAYVGRMTDGGRRISGWWRIGDQTGPFEMAPQ